MERGGGGLGAGEAVDMVGVETAVPDEEPMSLAIHVACVGPATFGSAPAGVEDALGMVNEGTGGRGLGMALGGVRGGLKEEGLGVGEARLAGGTGCAEVIDCVAAGVAVGVG